MENKENSSKKYLSKTFTNIKIKDTYFDMSNCLKYTKEKLNFKYTIFNFVFQLECMVLNKEINKLDIEEMYRKNDILSSLCTYVACNTKKDCSEEQMKNNITDITKQLFSNDAKHLLEDKEIILFTKQYLKNKFSKFEIKDEVRDLSYYLKFEQDDKLNLNESIINILSSLQEDKNINKNDIIESFSKNKIIPIICAYNTCINHEKKHNKNAVINCLNEISNFILDTKIIEDKICIYK